MRALGIASLAVRDLRNLAQVDLEPGARFNVVSGDNGQGKTNLLEAIYVLATSRSFRASKPGELVRHGAEQASVRAVVVEEGAPRREQSVGLRAGGRVAKIDGKRPPTLASYAVQTPAVVFHPAALALSSGGGSERRRLLDRVALYMTPASLADGGAYARALRERQRALEDRGVAARDLEHWEVLVARHGIALSDARGEAVERLATSAAPAYARIVDGASSLGIAYARSAPATVDEFVRELASRREQDLRRGGASMGPHRDDLALSLDGTLARGFASQGQHRAIVLALELAEISVVGTARDVHPILLLDDVSSELDRTRTAALFAFLRERRGQVFLTTTRPELIDTGETADRVDFMVETGSIRRC